MYYKIENKECEVYLKLHDMRTKELQIEKDNEKAIEDKTGLKWEEYFGNSGQQNWNRVTQYKGFIFSEPEKVDLKIWNKNNEGVFVPNKRTKLGREMSEFLMNGLKGNRYDKPFEILKIQKQRRFTFPFIEIGNNDIIVLFFDDNHLPKDENVIEITRKEFDAILEEQ